MSDTSVTAREQSLPYLPGLDGLRALAVAAVLIYHAGDESLGGIHWLRGGYLGVEVFFVISGYLITSLLINEHRATHGTAFRAFWMRRARRLLPALYALIGFWTAYAVLFLRDEVERIRGDIVSGFLYITNWYQISTTSYVTNTATFNNERPSVFKHLWSLAVEEQYYILWPVIFFVVVRAVGLKRMRHLVQIASLAAAAWMAANSLFRFLPGYTNFSLPLDDHNLDPTRLYEGTDTRASGLLIGSWLAFVWLPGRFSRRVGKGAPIFLDVVAVGALIWLFRLHQATEFKSAYLYRGGMFLVAVLSCVVIATAVHPASHIGRLLGTRLLRWIGLRSYGIYLWHWPIFQVTRPSEDIPLHGVANLVLRLTLTLGAAEISFRFIEAPVRKGHLGDWWHRFLHDRRPLSTQWRRRWVAALAVLAGIGGITGAAVMAATPFCSSDDPLGCIESTPEADSLPNFNRTTAPTTATASTIETIPGATTSTTIKPVETTNIVAIGDSVMLGAADTLRAAFGADTFVDAKVSRAPVGGVARLEQIASVGGLFGADVVVIHLGTNGDWGDKDFERMMKTLKNFPRVIVLNTRMPRSWQDSVNLYLKSNSANYSNVQLLDWNKLGNSTTATNNHWFARDGFHLNTSGREAYASAIAKYIRDPTLSASG